jgi:hypothetical protein
VRHYLRRSRYAVKWSNRRLASLAGMAMACTIGLIHASATATGADAVPSADAWRETDADYSSWAVDPSSPGPDLPPAGRSLFDHLVTARERGRTGYRVPFPFSALIERIEARLAQQERNGGTRAVMIPMGRSLQRTAAAPDFFKYPRIVFAVTGEPTTNARDAGVLLKDRVYLGYVEKTGVLEVISYNEAAGRFEFQLVKDYRAGARPKVLYANRAICISCHQNQAPIFSKAVWGETNANNRVAQLLRSQRGDSDLSPQANVDFPDDIDKATVRANTLVTLQSLWRRGCDDTHDPSRSRRCRAAAFTAALQYGLSGEQDFDSSSPSYQDDFVSTFGRVWRRTWPQGLSVAQSSLPDRNPFGAAASYYGGDSGEVPVNWSAAAHVPATLDPLNPRPPREIWRFTGALDTQRFIAGWAKFFATGDFHALDAHLAQHGQPGSAGRVIFRSQCTVARDPPHAGGFKLQCANAAPAAHSVHLEGRLEETGSGRIDWLSFHPAGQVRDVALDNGTVRRVGAAYLMRASPRRKGLGARLPDGRALESVEIRWATAAPAEKDLRPVEARVEVVVVDDFVLVRQSVDRLLAQQPWLFDDAPLARARLMRALFSELGLAERSWCCVDSADMPPAMLDIPEAGANALAERELQPFFRYCAMCHLTREQFPPNFLSGDAAQLAENLRQCAPRMLVRLAAWRSPADQRVKSPMPPPTFLQGLGIPAQRWAGSEDLELLRDYVERLARREGKASDGGAPWNNDYEALPRCLPLRP